jgi:site-specific recombinase XerD
MTMLTLHHSAPLDLHPGDDDGLVGRWLASQRSANTEHAYRRDLADFRQWLDQYGTALPAVSRAVIDLYRRHVEAQGLKPSTVARRLASLSSFYDYLHSEQVVPVNPVRTVKRPKLSDTSPRQWLDKDQARHCLTVAGDLSPVHQALMGLCLLAGLRVSEALGLCIEDIGQAQGHTVARVTRKGGHAEDVVLSDACLSLLTPVIAGRQSGPVIVGPRGGTVDRHRAARLIGEVGRRAGLDRRLVPHDLRHSCGVLSLAAGAPLDRVQQQLGHADPRTTQRYTRHLDRLDHAAAYDLAGFLGDEQP